MGESRARFVASIERFTGLLMDRLKESPSGKLLDEKEIRMLGSVVTRVQHLGEGIGLEGPGRGAAGKAAPTETKGS